MAATCSLIAGRSPRRRMRAPVSAESSVVQRPSAKICERLVAGLVVHLGAARNPVAEIDVRQAGLGGQRDVVEDDVAAEAVAGEVGVEEGIDHRHAVREDVGQADRSELALAAALARTVVLDHPAADRAFLDHRRELAHVHVGHAAGGVAGVEIAAEEVVLRLGRPGAARHPLEGGVAPEHPALVARRGEVGHDDPRREAGGAAGTGGAVEHVLRAAEALVRQHVVEMPRAFALQRGEELALDLAGKVGARLRSRHVELVRLRQRVAHDGPGVSPF